MPPNRLNGFTLVELLVVLLLLAILGSLAMPAFAELIARNRQQALLNQVQGILQHARTQAILQRRTIEVCGSADAQTCSANWASGWLTRTLSSEQILHITQLPNHDALRWSGFTQSIRFHSNGTSPTGNGRFYQCHKQGVAWQLILNRQGRLRIGTAEENTSKASLCTT